MMFDNLSKYNTALIIKHFKYHSSGQIYIQLEAKNNLKKRFKRRITNSK